MTSRFLLPCLVIVLLGWQIVSLTLSAREAPVPPGTPQVERVDEAELQGLRATVADLTARLEALEGDSLVPVAALSAPAPREVVDPGWVTRDELEARLAELLGKEALEGKVRPTSPKLDPEAFDEALAASRKRQATRKFESGAEMRAQLLDQRVAKYEAALELTPSQSGSLRTALENQQAREAELLRQWNAGIDNETLGQQKRQDRQAFEDELGGFLTDEQRAGVLGGGKD